MPEIYLTCV